MELQHVNVKLHLKNSGGADLELLIPIFHDWVKEQSCEEILIDVADYRHVPGGPGIILIGHEADFSLDEADRHLGVRYNRKAPLPGSNQSRFRQALKAALATCNKLEADPRLSGNLNLECQDIELFINDRLLAPNDPSTHHLVIPEIQQFYDDLFGKKNYLINHQEDPRKLFSVLVHLFQPINRANLLKKFAAS